MDRIAGIGEYIISNSKRDTIKTFALASCVAVTAYSMVKNVAGMVHIVLPYPFDHMSSDSRRCYYVESGIPFFIDKIRSDYGCHKGELEIGLYGGADSIRSYDIFNIGSKNIKTAKKILSNMGLKVSRYEVGGTYSRTLDMDVATGNIKVSLQPIKI